MPRPSGVVPAGSPARGWCGPRWAPAPSPQLPPAEPGMSRQVSSWCHVIRWDFANDIPAGRRARLEFRAMSAARTPPLLFTPLALRGVTARNRVVVSPMCQYSSEQGGPTDYHLVHLGKFAMGGAGIVFCEETAVEARGRKSHHCAGIYSDAHVPGYRRVNDFIRGQARSLPSRSAMAGARVRVARHGKVTGR